MKDACVIHGSGPGVVWLVRGGGYELDARDTRGKWREGVRSVREDL